MCGREQGEGKEGRADMQLLRQEGVWEELHLGKGDGEAMEGMKRHGEWRNACLAEVVGRFQKHARVAREGGAVCTGAGRGDVQH